MCYCYRRVSAGKNQIECDASVRYHLNSVTYCNPRKKGLFLKILLRWVFIVLLVMAAAYGFTVLYGNYVADTSLQSLELALQMAETPAENISPRQKYLYQQMLKDLTSEEVSFETGTIKKLVLLDAASRSIAESNQTFSLERAKYYLNQIAQEKESSRSPFLRFSDYVYEKLKEFYEKVGRFFQYTRSKIFGQDSEIVYEETGSILLDQAEQSERDGNLETAANTYAKFLELYPERYDWGYVAVNLSRLLIRQGLYSDAQKWLGKVQRLSDKNAGALAGVLLKRIENFEKQEKTLRQIDNSLQKTEEPVQKEELQLKAASILLSTYQFDKAKNILETLIQSSNPEVAPKAKFYLAWLSKNNNQYQASEKLFKDLLEDPNLSEDIKLALHAELADVYYQSNEIEKSLSHYNALTETSDRMFQEGGGDEVLASLAQAEKAKIYYFDMDDSIQAEESLRRFESLQPTIALSDALADEEPTVVTRDLRRRAFDALYQGRVHAAIDSFNRYLTAYSQDGWSFAGLSAAYAILGDIDKAFDYAQKGYELGADEYTASMMGFIYNLRKEPEKAVAYYLEAHGRNIQYIPAQYNLAYAYLTNRQFAKAVELLSKIDLNGRGMTDYMRSKILNNLGYGYLGLQDYANAKQNFQLALEYTPNFPIALRNLKELEQLN